MRIVPVLFVSLGLAGCSNDFCTKNYDKMKECASSDELGRVPEKSEYVERCQAEIKKAKDDGKFDEEDNKAQLTCLAKNECDEVKSCMSDLSAKRYAKKRVDEVNVARESDDPEKMKDACRYVDEEDKDLLEACKPVLARLTELTMAAVTKLRDEGKHDWGACSDLEAYAKASGGDEAAAKALCAETKASESATETLAKVAENVAAKAPKLPYQCESTIKELDTIGSDWAKTKKGELIEACYGDLGAIILASEVPGMKYACGYQVRQVYDAVKTHNIESDELRDWIAKAEPLCAKGA